MRKGRKLLLVLAMVLAVYLGYGHYLGQVAGKLTLAAWHEEAAYGIAAPGWGDEQRLAEVRWQRPLVMHWFGGGRVWLKYDDPELEVPGGVQLSFGLERQEGQWRISDLHSHYPV